MCLWFVQMCPHCGAYTSIPSARPIPCNMSWCYRKHLDPHHLTLDQDLLDQDLSYLSLDNHCYTDCPFEDFAIRKSCYCSDTDKDSESDQESGIDYQSVQPNTCLI